MCNNRISSHLEGSIFGSGAQNIHRQYYGLQNLSNHFKNKGVQTDYRESDCQTLPWEPPYQIAPGHNPEVLMLKHFRWGMELPAGMHELEIINRMRKRRAWERILPPMDTLANIKIRSALIADLENDEWAFREAEIQFLMNLRMALEDTSMQYKANKKNKQTENRLKKLNENLNKRKQQEMDSIRNTFTRELRKLKTKHRSIRTGQEKSSIIKLHAERNLNFYNPKLRRGCVAEYYYDESFSDINEFEREETSLDWFFVTREPNYTTSKPFIRICPRVSKRNNKKLLELSQNLESIKTKFEFSDTYDSLKRKEQIMLLPATPCQLPPKRFENEMDLPSSFLRKILNGRAEQCMIFEEKYHFKDLIKDLQSVQILENSNNLSNETIRLKLKQLEKNCNEILQAIDGKTIVNVLIFLNNELTTLYKETAYVSFLYKEKAQTREQFELQRFRAAQASVKKCMSVPANYVDTNFENIDEEVFDIIYNFILPEIESELFNKQTNYLYTRSINNDRKLKVPVDQSLPDEDFMSDLTDYFMENSTSCEFENYKIYKPSTYNISNDEDSFKQIIELILKRVTVPEGSYKLEVCNILTRMLRLAKQRTNDFQYEATKI